MKRRLLQVLGVLSLLGLVVAALPTAKAGPPPPPPGEVCVYEGVHVRFCLYDEPMEDPGGLEKNLFELSYRPTPKDPWANVWRVQSFLRSDYPPNGKWVHYLGSQLGGGIMRFDADPRRSTLHLGGAWGGRIRAGDPAGNFPLTIRASEMHIGTAPASGGDGHHVIAESPTIWNGTRPGPDEDSPGNVNLWMSGAVP